MKKVHVFVSAAVVIAALAGCSLFGAGGGNDTGSLPTLPGVEYLGHGYDVFGPYATPGRTPPK